MTGVQTCALPIFLHENIAILGPIFFFIGVLVLGLFYEVRKGALQWEK